ncbi:MAG TPA: hypothetical protein VKP65_00190 [Rhodothermales bacterium]|nr:hypothetical protein [Rhodothermales bacterium]
MDRDTVIKDIDCVLHDVHHLRKSRWSGSVFAEIQSLLSACIDRRALKGTSHIREKNYALRKFNSGQMLASHIQQNVADHLEGILRGVRSDWLALPEDHSQNSMIQPEQDYLHRLEMLFSNFHRVARHLLSRHSNRPTIEITDEYDVQDLLRALLCLDFADIRSEEWTPSYAGGSARTDFLLKPEKAVIELNDYGLEVHRFDSN